MNYRGLIAITLFCLNTSLFAQDFMKGDIIISASMGIPHLHKVISRLNTKTEGFKNSFRGTAKVTSINGTNPLAFKYEYGISNHFGIGVSVGFWSVRLRVKDSYDFIENPNTPYQTTKQYVDAYSYKFSSISFGIRPNFHLPLSNKKADLFVGCAIGITKNKTHLDFNGYLPGSSTYVSGYFEKGYKAVLYLAPTIGYRRYLTANVGLNLEAGFEKGALLQAGLMFRFRPLKYEPIKYK